MSLYCPIRKRWVTALPEERVRQELLQRMLQQLGYPESLIVVEKALGEMPHLKSSLGHIPNRRADILCFGNEAGLFPLLLIECKAVSLNAKVINQVIGYNAHVKARYIAIANQVQVRTGWYDPKLKGYAFVERLPTYEEITSKKSRH